MHSSSSTTVSRSWEQGSVHHWELGVTPGKFLSKMASHEQHELWDHPSTSTEQWPRAEQQHCADIPACSTCLRSFSIEVAAPSAAVPVHLFPAFGESSAAWLDWIWALTGFFFFFFSLQPSPLEIRCSSTAISQDHRWQSIMGYHINSLPSDDSKNRSIMYLSQPIRTEQKPQYFYAFIHKFKPRRSPKHPRLKQSYTTQRWVAPAQDQNTFVCTANVAWPLFMPLHIMCSSEKGQTIEDLWDNVVEQTWILNILKNARARRGEQRHTLNKTFSEADLSLPTRYQLLASTTSVNWGLIV